MILSILQDPVFFSPGRNHRRMDSRPMFIEFLSCESWVARDERDDLDGVRVGHVFQLLVRENLYFFFVLADGDIWRFSGGLL